MRFNLWHDSSSNPAWRWQAPPGRAHGGALREAAGAGAGGAGARGRGRSTRLAVVPGWVTACSSDSTCEARRLHALQIQRVKQRPNPFIMITNLEIARAAANGGLSNFQKSEVWVETSKWPGVSCEQVFEKDVSFEPEISLLLYPSPYLLLIFSLFSSQHVQDRQSSMLAVASSYYTVLYKTRETYR
jgi:hypothetical protein